MGVARTLCLLCIMYSSATLEVLKSNTTHIWDQHTYKLMYKAETWNEAKLLCADDTGNLAVPQSKEEFLYLQSVIRQMHLPSVVGTDYKLLAWLGVSKQGQTWKNIEGVNIENTGFNSWAGDHDNGGVETDDDPREPHCAGMDAMNFGLREFWCHRRQPYICEIKTS